MGALNKSEASSDIAERRSDKENSPQSTRLRSRWDGVVVFEKMLRKLSTCLIFPAVSIFCLGQIDANATVITIGCGGAQTCQLDQLIAGGAFITGSTLFTNWSIVNLPYPSGVPAPALNTSKITIDPFEGPKQGPRQRDVGFDIIPGKVPTPCGDFGALQNYAGACSDHDSHSMISFEMEPIEVVLQNSQFAVDFGYVIDTEIIQDAQAFIRQTISDVTGESLSDVTVACQARHNDCSNRRLASDKATLPSRARLKVGIEEEILVGNLSRLGNTAEITGVHMRYLQVPEPGTLWLVAPLLATLSVARRRWWGNRQQNVRKAPLPPV